MTPTTPAESGSFWSLFSVESFPFLTELRRLRGLPWSAEVGLRSFLVFGPPSAYTPARLHPHLHCTPAQRNRPILHSAFCPIPQFLVFRVSGSVSVSVPVPSGGQTPSEPCTARIASSIFSTPSKPRHRHTQHLAARPSSSPSAAGYPCWLSTKGPTGTRNASHHAADAPDSKPASPRHVMITPPSLCPGIPYSDRKSEINATTSQL